MGIVILSGLGFAATVAGVVWLGGWSLLGLLVLAPMMMLFGFLFLSSIVMYSDLDEITASMKTDGSYYKGFKSAVSH